MTGITCEKLTITFPIFILLTDRYYFRTICTDLVLLFIFENMPHFLADNFSFLLSIISFLLDSFHYPIRKFLLQSL